MTHLSIQPLLLFALNASGRQEFWKNHLRHFVNLASDWGMETTAFETEIYEVFCFQFQQTLNRWAKHQYEVEQIPMIAERLYLWSLVDGEYLRFIKNIENNSRDNNPVQNSNTY